MVIASIAYVIQHATAFLTSCCRAGLAKAAQRLRGRGSLTRCWEAYATASLTSCCCTRSSSRLLWTAWHRSDVGDESPLPSQAIIVQKTGQHA